MDESSEGNLWRVIEHSTKFEAREKSTWAIEYSTWAHGIQLLLSMSKEEDICAVLRGAQRPSAESSAITNSNSVGGGGDDDGGKKEGAMTVARWDRASSRLHGVLCLTTTGIPQGLVKRHGGNHRAGGIGNGPNGQAGWRELKAKYASRRVIRDALNNTQMSVGQDPDEYLNTLHQLRTDLQKEHGEVVSDDELEFIVIEHLTEEYDFVRTLFVTKDPEFGLAQIEATMQRRYMRRSRQAANTPKETGYCCCEPGGIKAKCRALQKNASESWSNSSRCGAMAGKWCSKHRSTTHNDAECRAQQRARVEPVVDEIFSF
ncbi:unnamed protein product [Ectocarpus sp. 8 AP-2014]